MTHAAFPLVARVLLCAALVVPAAACSQAPFPAEPGGSSNGNNNSNGGGCGCGCGCSVLVTETEPGDGTFQFSDDWDNDGWEDDFDNCPFAANVDQVDADGDGFGDQCDNCAGISNTTQRNNDGDAQGDVCDDDMDNDDIPNVMDNCPLVANVGPFATADDVDRDGLGNLCDDDDDNDGVLDGADNCPSVANPAQDPADPEVYGVDCRTDDDQDGIPEGFDTCPTVPSVDIFDRDLDGVGDACDQDRDDDGVVNQFDNCATIANATHMDADRDGLGDMCDVRFCFTVDTPEPSRCLDPEGPFFARPGPDLTVATGEPVRLRLFANRIQTAIRFVWTVESTPGGVRGWTLSNATGAATHSTPWEYRYTRGRVPEFSGTRAGEYVLRLDTQLVFPDDKGFAQDTSSQTMRVRVEDHNGPLPSGCASTTPWSLWPMALLVLLRRRAVVR